MTRRHIRLRRRAADDQGAILIIAILVISVVALVTGFVLTRGDGSIRATVALRGVAGSTYAADGAAQLAINALRTGYSPGDPNGPTHPDNVWAYNNVQPGPGCFGLDGLGDPVHDLELPQGFYPETGRQTAAEAPSARVECEPENASGASGSPVPVTNANKPGNAILTLGTNPSEIGIDIKPQSSSVDEFRVHGGIWSNSNIVASNGPLKATTSIRANTGCTPLNWMDAPVVDCSASPVPDPEIAEPAKYAHDAAADVPTWRSVPKTSACDGVVEFEPGYYDDAQALNVITDSNVNACKDSTFWFKPGTYYFDFHNNTADPMYDADIAASGGSEWVVGEGDLVAGTPAGNIANPVFPESCVNPIDNVDNEGVQFIFGGDSRLKVNDGANVEICGTYHTDRPPIAIYALKAGTVTSTVLSEAADDDGDSLKASSVSIAPSDTFTGTATADAMAGPGNGDLSWARTSTSNPASATISLDGFEPEPTDPIPPGAILKSASLLVTHQEATASSIKFTPTGATTSQTTNLTVRTNSTTDTVDLAALGNWGAIQDYVHDNGFTGAKVEFTGKPKNGETTALDGVRLQLTYYLPQLRAQTSAGFGTTNCLETLNSCAVISTPTNYKDHFYIQGTTYAPISRIDLNLNQATAQVMRFGLIARSLAARTTGGFAYEGPVIELPDNSPGFGFNGTIVQLEVYLCEATSSCATGGDLELKVRAQMWDDSGTPEPPKRQVTVLNWSHQR